MTLTEIKLHRLTALEDLHYRLASSYPVEGFGMKQGESITITPEGLKLFTAKGDASKRRAKFSVEAL